MNPNPSPETRFQKGISGNPTGKPSIPEDVRQIQIESKAEVLRLLHECAHLSIHSLTETLANKDNTALKMVIARLYSKAIGGSAPHVMEILNRLAGKTKEEIAISAEPTSFSAIMKEISESRMREVNEPK